MPENAHMGRKPKRIPEPLCAAVPGKDWGPPEFAEFEELLQDELTPRWLGQVRKARALAGEAEDVVQAFHVKIQKSLIEKYKPEVSEAGDTSFIAYLGTCFRRHLADEWRIHQREGGREEPLDEENHRGHVVHINAERQAELLALRDAIEALPGRRRKVIRLSSEGFSFAEIGKALGIKANHARVEAFAARQQLKRILQKGQANV